MIGDRAAPSRPVCRYGQAGPPERQSRTGGLKSDANAPPSLDDKHSTVQVTSMNSPIDPSEDRVALPLLPLRDVVVFPHMVIPLFVGRPKSIKALETAMEAGKSILLVAQKSAAKDEPSAEDLYRVGSIANILQMLKLPDGTVKVLVEGAQRATIDDIDDLRTHYAAEAVPVAERSALGGGVARDRGDAPRDDRAVRPVRETQQEDSAGDPDLARRHRRGRPPGRHHRRAPAAQARAEAGSAGDVRRQAPPGAPARRCSRRNSTSSRWRSASAAASSGRWRRASASTT